MRTSRLIAAVGAVAILPAGLAAASIEVTPAVPGTAVSDTFTFTNQAISTFGVPAFADATVLSFTNTYDVDTITLDSASLTEINAATWASEARIEIFDGSGFDFGTIQPFTDQTYTGPLTTGPQVFNVAGVGINTTDGVALNFFESFDDGSDLADDQVWNEIVFTFSGEIGGTPAVVDDEFYAAPGSLSVGDTDAYSGSHVSGGNDFYTFTLTEDGVVSLQTTDPGSGIDTEIGLYDSAGNLISSNDDEDFVNNIFTSLLTETLTAGDYTVVIGTFNTDMTAALVDVTAGTGSGAYDFNVSVAAIPEPGSLALLGLGGLAMLRRRR